MTVRTIVDCFLRSEFFSNWQADRIESGSYSRDPDQRDRYNRCYDAASDGADGSTHREHIEDMREAFREYLNRRNNRLPFREYAYRLESAVMEHLDEIEEWHRANGSLDQEVG